MEPMKGTRTLAAPAVWVTAVVAAVVFAVAYDDAGYALTTWSALAVAVWWTILVGVALGVWPLGRLTRGAVLPGCLARRVRGLAPRVGRVVLERRGRVRGVRPDGAVPRDLRPHGRRLRRAPARALGRRADARDRRDRARGARQPPLPRIVSRVAALPTFLPNAATRLSFPLDYWNGLGIFVAIAIPLLLGVRARRRTAAGGRSRSASFPRSGAVVYLTSSRGAVAALDRRDRRVRRWRSHAAGPRSARRSPEPPAPPRRSACSCRATLSSTGRSRRRPRARRDGRRRSRSR